jgi:hypothetical protein
VGQTLSFCEVVDGQPKLVYRFVTSSLRNAPPPLYRYYAPINVINSFLAGSDRMARSERSPHIVGLGFEVLQTNISEWCS